MTLVTVRVRALQRMSALIALVAASLAPRLAVAQCPDGSPPPCSARAIARAAVVTVPTPSERARRFVILPFRNVTRQADQEWLVEGSTTMLVEALSRWKGISVVSDEKLYPALKRAGMGAGSVADAPKVRRIAEETGGWTAVTGEVIATGGRLRISARAWDVPTNKELVRATSEVPVTGDVRLAFDSVSLRLLRSAGVDSISADMLASTSQNVDAYRAYLRGLAYNRRGEIKLALAAFEEAVKADTVFALAWARLAEAQVSAEPLSILQPNSKASQSSARAVALSAKLPARARQLVLANDAQFRAQFTDVRTILTALHAEDSTDVEVLEQLVGMEMFDPLLQPVPGGMRPRGSLNRAAQYAKRVVTLDPGRRRIFGMLAQIYSQAGIPGGTPVFGAMTTAASLPEFLRSLSSPGNLRVYAALMMGDTIGLVPSESLSFVPKDSLKALRKTARAASRAWNARWITASGGEAAPYMLESELANYDGDYPAALRAVAKAESLGVQSPGWVPSARRLLFHAKAGRHVEAMRLADSLNGAGWFKAGVNQMQNGDVMAWAWGLQLMSGRWTTAATMYDTRVAAVRFFSPECPVPTLCALRALMGNEDPDDEPRITKAFRRQELDTLAAHIGDVTSTGSLATVAPVLLPMLAEAADSSSRPWPVVIRAAEQLAQLGRNQLAFDLASNAVRTDSTLRPRFATAPWYRTGTEAMNAAREEARARMHPVSATLGTDRMTFEWKIDDATPFTRNRTETPPGRPEYVWEVALSANGRGYEALVTAGSKAPGAVPTSVPLAELVTPKSTRVIITGKLNAAGTLTDTTALQGSTVRTELQPGVLRMIVSDTTVLGWVRREKPSQVEFRFFPCTEPVEAARQCLKEKIAIRYP